MSFFLVCILSLSMCVLAFVPLYLFFIVSCLFFLVCIISLSRSVLAFIPLYLFFIGSCLFLVCIIFLSRSVLAFVSFYESRQHFPFRCTWPMILVFSVGWRLYWIYFLCTCFFIGSCLFFWYVQYPCLGMYWLLFLCICFFLLVYVFFFWYVEFPCLGVYWLLPFCTCFLSVHVFFFLVCIISLSFSIVQPGIIFMKV